MKLTFTRLLPRYEEEGSKPNPPEDKFVYKRDSGKTIREIAVEAKERQKKQKEEGEKKEKKAAKPAEEPKEEIKPDENAKVDDTPIEEGKETQKPVEKKEEPKVDTEEVARKAAEEAAKKVAEETKAAFAEQIEKILSKDKDILEKQKEADELVAIWDKENRLPKDWREIASEQIRIADAKLEQRLAAQKKANDDKLEEERKAAETQKQDAQSQEKAKLEDFQKQIAADLDEIYTAKMLPKPADINEINNPNTTDPAAKETQEVIAFGIKLNTERAKQNLPPVTSLNKIFFLHYQPYKIANASAAKKDAQPAGADAPVSGAKSTPTTETKKAFVYARDHHKTFAQLAAEIKAKVMRK